MDGWMKYRTIVALYRSYRWSLR